MKDPSPVKALEKIQKQVTGCTKCPLHQERLNAVFGEGPWDAPIMVIGEGPGANEDKQGLPFVGRAGKLLDQLLEQKQGSEEAGSGGMLSLSHPSDPTH